MWSKVRFQVINFLDPKPKEPENIQKIDNNNNEEEEELHEKTEKTQSPRSPITFKKRDSDSFKGDVLLSNETLPSAPPNTQQDTVSLEDDSVTTTFGSLESTDTTSLRLGKSPNVKKKDKTFSIKRRRPRSPKKSLCLNPKNQDNAQPMTSIYVNGMGNIPVVKGDPKILPEKVLKFIAEKVYIMKPRAIYICDGSIYERDEMIRKLKNQGILKELKGYPNAYNVRTNPDDTARVEAKTFITTKDRNTTETR